MNEEIPEGAITAYQYAEEKSISEEVAILRIQEGVCSGVKIGEDWYVLPEGDTGGDEVKERHRYQDDLDAAQKAKDIGSSLSGLSTFIHIVAAIVFISTSGMPDNIAQLGMLAVGVIGAAVSWSIIFALLSIVVTNALTAKHVIYQSSKHK